MTNPKFSKSAGGINDGLNGAFYQVKLLMLFAFKACQHNLAFQLGTEIKEAGKFDDLLFKYKSAEQPNNFCFLQAKFKKNAKKIGLDTLLVDNNFNLSKYFRSYKEIRRTVNVNEIEEIVICTNNVFDFSSVDETAHIFELKKSSKEKLWLEKLTEIHKIFGNFEHRYKFSRKHQEACEQFLLLHFEDYVMVAKELAEHVVTQSHKEDRTFLAKYRAELEEFVFDSEAKRFREEFLTGSDPELSHFRDSFEVIFKKIVNSNFSVLPRDLRLGLKRDFWGFLEKVPVNLEFLATDVPSASEGSKSVLGPSIKPHEIQEFLEKLIFVTNLSEHNIESIMRDPANLSAQISNFKSFVSQIDLRNFDLVFHEFEKEILGWIKNSDKVFLDESDVERVFSVVTERVFCLHLVGLQREFSEQYGGNAMKFRGGFHELSKFSENPEKQIFLVESSTGDSRVHCVRIFQHLKQNFPEKFLLGKSSLSPKNLQLIFESFRVSKDLLLFEWMDEQVPSVFQDFLQLLDENSVKKLILVSSNKNLELFFQNNFKNSSKVAKSPPKDFKVSDLTDPSIDGLLAQKIDFQGIFLPLQNFLQKSEILQFPLRDFCNLNSLKVGENFCVTPKVSRNLYIEREVYTPFRVDPRILKEEKDGVLLDFQEFEAMKKKFPGKNFHLLGVEDRELTWKKSHGNPSAIEKFFFTQCLKELDLIHTVHSLTILSDQAGMGKSTLISSLIRRIKEETPGHFVIRINLNDVTKELERIPKSGALNFLMRILQSSENLEKIIVQNFLGSFRELSVFLDGFDEVCPHYEGHVETLLQYFKGARVFVSTRPEHLHKISDRAGVSVYSLVPFTEQDQMEYLVRYWQVKYSFTDDLLCPFARNILRGIYSSVNDHKKLFIGNPLITNMIADLYENELKTIEDSDVSVEDWLAKIETLTPNISRLYENFVSQKYRVFFHDKFKSDLSNSFVIDIAKKLEKDFTKIHTRFALLEVFGDEDLKGLGVQLEEVDDEDLENVLKCGILYKHQGGLRFTHKTFAEHFVARFLMKNPGKFGGFVVGKILVGEDYKMLRIFINTEVAGFEGDLGDFGECLKKSVIGIEAKREEESQKGSAAQAQKEPETSVQREFGAKSQEKLKLQASGSFSQETTPATPDILKGIRFLEPPGIPSSSSSPLHIAAQEKDLETLNFLLKSLESQPDLLRRALSIPDNQGNLVIHYYLQHCNDNFQLLSKIKETLGISFLIQQASHLNQNLENSLFFANRNRSLLKLLEFLRIVLGAQDSPKLVAWLSNSKGKNSEIFTEILAVKNKFGCNCLRYFLSGYLEEHQALAQSVDLFRWISTNLGKDCAKQMMFLEQQSNLTFLHNFVLSCASRRNFIANFLKFLEFLLCELKFEKEFLKDLFLAEDAHQMNLLHLLVFESSHEISESFLKLMKWMKDSLKVDVKFVFCLFTVDAYDGVNLVGRMRKKLEDFENFVCELQALLGKDFDLTFFENID